jgi:heme/copper-type cytochrome/quinol oxidase subunit 2
METESSFKHRFPPLPRNALPLWIAVVIAPAVWGLELQIVYSAAHQACIHNKHGLLHLLDAIALVIVAVCAVVCWRYRRRDDNEQDRTTFLAEYGLWSSAGFFVLIVAQTIASIMLDPCAT